MAVVTCYVVLTKVLDTTGKLSVKVHSATSTRPTIGLPPGHVMINVKLSVDEEMFDPIEVSATISRKSPRNRSRSEGMA